MPCRKTSSRTLFRTPLPSFPIVIPEFLLYLPRHKAQNILDPRCRAKFIYKGDENVLQENTRMLDGGLGHIGNPASKRKCAVPFQTRPSPRRTNVAGYR